MSNGDKTGPGAAGPMSAAEREALTKRAADVGARIEAAQQRREGPRRAGAGSGTDDGATAQRGAAMGRGLKNSAELIGGVVAGGGLGWLLDRWLGTFPALFIVFFLLGSAAGMLNIIKQAKRETTPPAPSVADDDDV